MTSTLQCLSELSSKEFIRSTRQEYSISSSYTSFSYRLLLSFDYVCIISYISYIVNRFYQNYRTIIFQLCLLVLYNLTQKPVSFHKNTVFAENSGLSAQSAVILFIARYFAVMLGFCLVHSHIGKFCDFLCAEIGIFLCHYISAGH